MFRILLITLLVVFSLTLWLSALCSIPSCLNYAAPSPITYLYTSPPLRAPIIMVPLSINRNLFFLFVFFCFCFSLRFPRPQWVRY
uniref:Secreted protein n=1 Tax=Anopheles darlingi TaxID=43151 RepID=A0A2M4D315_ANODA